MVAGGGASVIYSDTICDLGGAKELANYGEYSGNFVLSKSFNFISVFYHFKKRSQDNLYFNSETFEGF